PATGPGAQRPASPTAKVLPPSASRKAAACGSKASHRASAPANPPTATSPRPRRCSGLRRAAPADASTPWQRARRTRRGAGRGRARSKPGGRSRPRIRQPAPDLAPDDVHGALLHFLEDAADVFADDADEEHL